MAVTDYESAWVRLMAIVASKSQHGREGLLTEMANLAAECRVVEGELPRVLRLYGVEVSGLDALNTRAEPVPSGRDDVAAGTAGSPTTNDLGGHDGYAVPAGAHAH